VLDGGTTSASRPYFVMDLVKGVPITRYCDEHHLTPRQRLELFVSVCQAVQHAHQKGIIHRDLKPSNVLVALYDGKPVPKVIDFGIAKATGEQLTDKTLVTGLGNVIGTLEYMSPEQAEINQLDIDTRSDVYSLGVLLYELLTGSTPLERKRLKDAALLEVLRVIREEEPPRPSTRLGTTEELPAVAAKRGLEPKKLSGVVRGELDWIVMKALEKDRNGRYESANGFALDVRRYLADEPVVAGPPSTWYRLRKFTRRNRAGVLLTTVALALVVVTGAGLWNWHYQEALLRAESNFHAELTRRSVESSLQQVPDLHRRALWLHAENLLDQAEQQLGPQGDTILRDRVAQARRETALLKRVDEIRLKKSVIIDRNFHYAAALHDYPIAFVESGLDVLGGDPVAVAAKLNASEVREYLLAALDDWAMLPDANERERILAITAAATGQAWRSKLDRVWGDGARLAEFYQAIPEAERTPAILIAIARQLAALGRDGIPPLEQGLRGYPGDFWLHFDLGVALAKDRPDAAVGAYRAALALRPGTPAVLNNLGNVLYRKQEYDAAMAEFKEASRLGPRDAVPHFNLGVVLYAKQEYDAAMAENREAIRLDPNFAEAHNNLGIVLMDRREYDAAVTEYREAIRLDPKWAGPHCNLGLVLADKKEYDAAVAEFREAIRLDPAYVGSHNGLGHVLYEKQEYDAAVAHFREAIRLDPKFARAHFGLGNALCARKEYDAAMAAYQAASRLYPNAALPHNGLGNALRDKQEYDAAMVEYQTAIRLDPKFAVAHHNLGLVLADKKEYDAAMAEFREAIRLDPKWAGPHCNLGSLLWVKSEHEAAMAEFQATLRLDPNNAEASCNLGRLYLAQGRFAEAVKLLKRGHELGSRRAGWPYPSAQWLKQAEQLLALDNQLAKVLHKEVEPAGAAEQLVLARFCQTARKRYAASARFYAGAFAAEPKLADDLGTQDRYNAACAAAIAGCAQGEDAGQLSDPERTRRRRQALDWLRADLDAWERLLAKEPTGDHPAARVAMTLQHWLADPDLAGVRESEQLGQIPEAERQPWQKLWADVAATLARARQTATPEKKPAAR
jgi:tetratricopeptide (TPR) repeat protein